jgi:hypothetical protein
MAKMSKKLKEINKWREIINRYTIPYPDTPIFQPLTFTEIRTNGWLPIETAPKDGERILVAWLGIVEIAIWNIEQKSWQEWPDGDFVCDTDEITHWMPLPNLPKE